MDKQAVKDFTYGAIVEMLRNKKYYYHSRVGMQYSHFTDEGKEVLHEIMSIMAFKMLEVEEAEIKQVAKEQTMAALKGDKT